MMAGERHDAGPLLLEKHAGCPKEILDEVTSLAGLASAFSLKADGVALAADGADAETLNDDAIFYADLQAQAAEQMASRYAKRPRTVFPIEMSNDSSFESGLQSSACQPDEVRQGTGHADNLIGLAMAIMARRLQANAATPAVLCGRQKPDLERPEEAVAGAVVDPLEPLLTLERVPAKPNRECEKGVKEERGEAPKVLQASVDDVDPDPNQLVSMCMSCRHKLPTYHFQGKKTCTKCLLDKKRKRTENRQHKINAQI
jgi:hypothetical protein